MDSCQYHKLLPPQCAANSAFSTANSVAISSNMCSNPPVFWGGHMLSFWGEPRLNPLTEVPLFWVVYMRPVVRETISVIMRHNIQVLLRGLLLQYTRLWRYQLQVQGGKYGLVQFVLGNATVLRRLPLDSWGTKHALGWRALRRVPRLASILPQKTWR